MIDQKRDMNNGTKHYVTQVLPYKLRVSRVQWSYTRSKLFFTLVLPLPWFAFVLVDRLSTSYLLFRFPLCDSVGSRFS